MTIAHSPAPSPRPPEAKPDDFRPLKRSQSGLGWHEFTSSPLYPYWGNKINKLQAFWSTFFNILSLFGQYHASVKSGEWEHEHPQQFLAELNFNRIKFFIWGIKLQVLRGDQTCTPGGSNFFTPGGSADPLDPPGYGPEIVQLIWSNFQNHTYLIVPNL